MLLNNISEGAGKSATTPSEQKSRSFPTIAQPLVLIIDDDPSILGVYGTALRMAGYRVATSESAEAALGLVKRESPDLILSDINMPNLDGVAFLREIRNHPNLQNIQIVLMTGNSIGASPRRVMDQGADDFLSKPLELEELYACVEARLKRAEINRRVRQELVADLRSSLGSTLPHEFFTPLAGMLGLTEVLRGEIETLPRGEMRGILDDIERSGLRLHRTLRNYLWIVEADRLPALKPAALSSERVVFLVENAARTAVRRHDGKVCLEKRLEASQPLFVEESALEIIVEELLSNALQFSQEGHPVTIELTARQLRVRDVGRGLKPDQLRAIGAFRQFDRKEWEQQGLGLGLALVRQLCSAMGAKFEVLSEPGQGTEVVITFQPPPKPAT